MRILFDIIDHPPTEEPDDDKPPLALSTARVEFVNVQFAYRAGAQAIKSPFVAEPGKLTALVGLSGGGKSTILNLMLRFYEVEGGAIVIDGQDIATVSRRSLAARSPMSGRTYSCSAARCATISRSAAGCERSRDRRRRQGGLRPRLHHGVSARLRRAGGRARDQFSGGERQRIAVARALLKDAPIILLDEATASLDSESERQVQGAIEHLCRGRTTIVIAHRLHTVVDADRIFVIEDGSVAESGRHDELLRKNGATPRSTACSCATRSRARRASRSRLACGSRKSAGAKERP